MDNYTLRSAFEVDKHIDPVAEANKRYEENLKVKKTKPVYDSRKLELFSEMDSQPVLALKACGLDFIKRICSVDQELAHNILSIFSQAVENDNFNDVEMSFRRIVAAKYDEEVKNNYRRR